VLEGGGGKGVGLVGAISALGSAGYELGGAGRVAGTSAGAVVGALLAAGARAAELERTMREVDYRRCRDAGPLGVVGSALSLVTRLGPGNGDRLHGWVAEQLAARKVDTFGNLRIHLGASTATTAPISTCRTRRATSCSRPASADPAKTRKPSSTIADVAAIVG